MHGSARYHACEYKRSKVVLQHLPFQRAQIEHFKSSHLLPNGRSIQENLRVIDLRFKKSLYVHLGKTK